MLRTLWTEESGAVLSAELVLILTIAVLAMIVGLSELAVAVNEELNDVSNAIGNLDQSYSFVGFIGQDVPTQGRKVKSTYAGSLYHDKGEECDHNESVVSCHQDNGECDNP